VPITPTADLSAELAAVQQLIRDHSPLPADKTEQIIRARFDAIPNRLAFALGHWPLATSRVLDVGCSYGNTLAFFGRGSVGVDNMREHVEFCQALGLEAVELDVDESLGALPDAGFDFIWVSDILEHLDAPRLLLRRLAAKLRPGGRLLVYMTSLPRSRVVRALLRRRGPVAFDAQTHYYQFTRETAEFIVERAGYRVTHVAVPLLDGRLRALTPFGRQQAPTLILEATPDAETLRLTEEAERKNKQR
jgi:SAM-dependent methyltransferase